LARRVRAFFASSKVTLPSLAGSETPPREHRLQQANDWLGQVPFDPLIESRFARFRALGKLLRNYRA